MGGGLFGGGGGSGGGSTTIQSGPTPEAAKIAGEFSEKASIRATDLAREQLDISLEELQRQFGLAREDLAPFREQAELALGQLGDLTGLGGQDAQQRSINELQQSPGFQFRREEASRAIDRGASARGLLGSGRRLKELEAFGQGLATDEIDLQRGRLSQLAGLQPALASSGLAQNLGSQISGLQTGFGTVAANAALASGQAQASAHLAANPQFQTFGGGSSGGGIGAALGGAGSLLGGLGGFFGGK